jgi:hypothetical protein
MRVFNRTLKLVPSGSPVSQKKPVKVGFPNLSMPIMGQAQTRIKHVGLIEIQILANGLIAPAVISFKCLKVWPYKKRVIMLVWTELISTVKSVINNSV